MIVINWGGYVCERPEREDILAQIEQALAVANLIELRVDLFSSLEFLQTLRSQISIPLILTLRSASQGGKSTLSLEERFLLLRSLAALQPDYLDLEWSTDRALIPELKHLQVILSHHTEALSALEFHTLYSQMRQEPAHFYKLAVHIQNSAEGLRLVNWARHNQDADRIIIGMGPYGQITRILSPTIHNRITYASLAEDPLATTLGQISACGLRSRYRFSSLKPKK